jgi:Tat protein secretion system quality control protein TatD with DNase activity
VSIEKQRIVFEAQLNIANETGHPLVIHCRDAEAEVFEILKNVIVPNFKFCRLYTVVVKTQN